MQDSQSRTAKLACFGQPKAAINHKPQITNHECQSESLSAQAEILVRVHVD